MIRIATHDLVGLLTDLALTAADPTDAGPTAAVLLHSARGYVGGSPGETSLLVGTDADAARLAAQQPRGATNAPGVGSTDSALAQRRPGGES